MKDGRTIAQLLAVATIIGFLIFYRVEPRAGAIAYRWLVFAAAVCIIVWVVVDRLRS